MKYQLRNKNFNNETPELALEELLKDRGIKQPYEWLHPDESYEHSPWLFQDMVKAVALLNKHIKNNESKILVVVDSDLDGYTSGAIIMTLLSNIHRDQEIQYVLHPNKEHGIVLTDIPDDTTLVIVPDAGSTQTAEHLKLMSDGMDLIILDHHEYIQNFDYGEYTPQIAIVNSQEPNYPNPALSGAGVAMKFVQAYYEKYGGAFPNKLYALAACGIIADVMDISYLENKQIITKGLRFLPEHAFLYQLIKDAHYNLENPTPTIKDIGWTIGPNINAIIRLGTQDQKYIIFRSLINPTRLVPSTKKGEDEEVPIYEEAVRLCKNAKKRQTTAVDKSIKIIEDNIEIKDNDKAIVYVDENQELTFELSGLIANKLLSQYNRPIILLRHYVDGGVDELRGSVRGKAADGLINLRDAITGITGVQKAEGHAFAFGIGIDKNTLNEFKAHLTSILANVDFNVNLYLIDLIAKASEVNIEMANIMARDDIWGHGVEQPMCLLTDVNLDQCEFMGTEQQHLKINCGQYDIVLFNVPELTDKLLKNEKYDLDVVGTFSVDKAYNVGRLQFMATDYELKPYTKKTVWDLVF